MDPETDPPESQKLTETLCFHCVFVHLACSKGYPFWVIYGRAKRARKSQSTIFGRAKRARYFSMCWYGKNGNFTRIVVVFGSWFFGFLLPKQAKTKEPQQLILTPDTSSFEIEIRNFLISEKLISESGQERSFWIYSGITCSYSNDDFCYSNDTFCHSNDIFLNMIKSFSPTGQEHLF